MQKLSMKEERIFNYLDYLQRTGQVNMYGAGEYLEDEFDLNKYEAKDWLLKWMTKEGSNG